LSADYGDFRGLSQKRFWRGSAYAEIRLRCQVDVNSRIKIIRGVS
jgi:hypothetical protein